jgi:predicted DNA binding CopG/RHH family protein
MNNSKKEQLMQAILELQKEIVSENFVGINFNNTHDRYNLTFSKEDIERIKVESSMLNSLEIYVKGEW